jgi:succinyl-CoA synthetase alpha subunit
VSVFINNDSRIIVQGITGRDGGFHAQQMKDYGNARLVGGVTPGKGGQEAVGVPVFNTVGEAVEATGANTSCIFVPPAFAVDAIYEAVGSGIKMVVCITEGVPANDMMSTYRFVKDNGARLIGPNCPGLISPGQAKVGILPGHICREGKVGVVSRSGTLTYEVVDQLTRNGLGQSTNIGIGGDPIVGTNFIDCLEAFEADPETEAAIMIGEIGGDDEEQAAEYIHDKLSIPVVSFIAGRTAPPGKRMGHAGAIVSGGKGTAESKEKALEAAGVPVAKKPSDLVPLLAELYAPAKAALSNA